MQALAIMKRSSPFLLSEKTGGRTLGPAPGELDQHQSAEAARPANEAMKGFAIRTLTAYSTVLLATTAPFVDASALVRD